MWSMAGITVARLGVAREKNSVASLSTYKTICKSKGGDERLKYARRVRRQIWSVGQDELTSKTSCNCCAILHSASDNSNARSSASRSAVIASIARRYSKANFNMSNVEFQRVATSHGIMRIDSLSFPRHSFQRGRSLVVEWMILKASFRSYERWLASARCVVICH